MRDIVVVFPQYFYGAVGRAAVDDDILGVYIRLVYDALDGALDKCCCIENHSDNRYFGCIGLKLGGNVVGAHLVLLLLILGQLLPLKRSSTLANQTLSHGSSGQRQRSKSTSKVKAQNL